MRAGISFQLWGEGPPSGDREEAGQGNLERQLSRARCTRPHPERKPLEGAACEPGRLLPVNSPSQAGGLLTRPTMPLGYCFKFYNKLLYSALLNKLQGRVATQTSSSPASPEPR